MNKQKLIKIVCMTLLVSAMIGTSAFAAGKKTYSAYALPSLQRNNYTGVHKKESRKDYITNYIDSYTSTSEATFWAANKNQSRISNKYDQKKGNKSDLVFTKTGYNLVGEQVCMGMENATWRLNTNAFVSGWVNFH